MRKLSPRHTFLPVYILASIVVLVSLSFMLLAATKTLADSTDNVTGYAWSETIGWISFNCTNTGCTDSDYGVDIDQDGNFGGYAWSEHIGWIYFAPQGPYPHSPDYAARLNFETDAVTGWARACTVFASGCSGALKPDSERGGWDGWISMSGADYGVTRGGVVGGSCPLNNYAWGGDVVGWIHFDGDNYGVSTTRCTAPPTAGVCGNGAVETGEQCDDGNNISGDGCSAICTIETTGVVGDGVLNIGEECDDGNTVSGDGCSSSGTIETIPGSDLENSVIAAGQNLADAQQAVTDAETALGEAQRGGNPEEIAEAEAALEAARLQEEVSYQTWDDLQARLAAAEDAVADYSAPAGPVLANVCTFPLQPTFSWSFSDPDSGDAQSFFQVQVSTQPNFNDQFIVVDSGKINSSVSAYTVNAAHLIGDGIEFNDKYYWRVRVWDSNDEMSEWAEGPRFDTPRHAYPSSAFIYSPQVPTVGGIVSFFDRSASAEGTSISQWRWRFMDAIPSVSYLQNPDSIFQSSGIKPIWLEVTDSDDLMCPSLPQSIRLITAPEFREI